MFATVFLLVGCSGGDDEKFSISENKLTLHFEETEQLTATATAEWSSENEFVAKVNSNGLVEGNHVGKTNIIATSANGSAKCEVEVLPVYSTYKEPYLEFGASKSTVKSKETRNLFDETSTALVYEGENSFVELVMYSFDDNGGLKGVALGISFASASEVTKFLLERYQPITVEDDVYIFVNNNINDCTMAVTLSVEKSYLAIVYLPYSSDSRGNDIEKQKEELKSLLNETRKKKF